MSRWQDPRIGTQKSALQKSIRRGDIDAAVSATQALLDLPGGRSAVARRLPVIAAEDVGPRWIPAVVRVTRQMRSVTDPAELDPELRRLAAGLASLPKSKDAYYLAATCWDGRRRAPDVSREALGAALESGAHQDAVAIYIAARESRQWRSGARVIDVLLERGREGPELTRGIVEDALWREAQGGSGTDELVAAAVIAAIDRPTGAPPEVPTVAAMPGLMRPPAWWAFDTHTLVGGRVIGRVAGRHGMRADTLAWIQFNCESIRLGPSEEFSRWREEALALDARFGGWDTQAAAERIWDSLRDEVRAEIELEVG